jgi:hypothetical protein
MKLSECSFENLQLGTHVRSTLTGNFGYIDQLVGVSDSVMDYGEEVGIRWEHGGFTYQPLMFLDAIVVE